jgi:hypothetical protein
VQSLDWQLHTMAAVQVQGASATLTQSQPGVKETRVGLRIIEPADAAFSVTDASPAGAPGQDQNQGVAKLTVPNPSLSLARKMRCTLAYTTL